MFVRPKTSSLENRMYVIKYMPLSHQEVLEIGMWKGISEIRNHKNYNMVKFLSLWKLTFNRFATTLQIYFLWFVIFKLIYFSLCEESVKLIIMPYKNVLRNAVTIINKRTKWLTNIGWLPKVIIITFNSEIYSNQLIWGI